MSVKNYADLAEENIKLRKENAMLRRKLSPLEDPEFTKSLQYQMSKVDLKVFTRNFRGGTYIVLYPKELYELLWGEEPNGHDITNLGRSLQALLWERSAISGNLCFVKAEEEYEREC